MKIKILSTLAVAAMLFSGCQKEDNAPTIESSYPTDGVVRIATSINALQTRSTTTDYAGTDLSLSVDYGSGNKYTENNIKWTKISGTWSPAEASNMMLWQDATTQTKVYAYAPYQEGQSSMTAVAFSAAVDQSGGLTSSDLVGFVNATFKPNEDLVEGDIPIELNHKMVQLNIFLTFGNEFGVSDPTVKSVSVLAKNAVTYNAATAAAPTVTATAVAITPKNGSGATYSVIIAPQTIAQSEKLVTVTIGDNTYSYNVLASAGHVFASGTAYDVKLRIGKDKIELVNGIEVGTWTAGSAITGGEATTP